jgi:hypothetical protein
VESNNDLSRGNSKYYRKAPKMILIQCYTETTTIKSHLNCCSEIIFGLEMAIKANKVKSQDGILYYFITLSHNYSCKKEIIHQFY